MIVANAIALGLETYDGIDRDLGAAKETANDASLGVFVVEMAIRIAAFGRRPLGLLPRRLERVRLCHRLRRICAGDLPEHDPATSSSTDRGGERKGSAYDETAQIATRVEAVRSALEDLERELAAADLHEHREVARERRGRLRAAGRRGRGALRAPAG